MREPIMTQDPSPTDENVAMSKAQAQRHTDELLGRLLTDAAFRTAFFADPRRACADSSFDGVSDEAVEMLTRLDRAALDRLAALLDPRIVRAATPRVAR